MSKSFKVLRAHFGDKPYVKGDTRVADERKVARLIKNGVLKEIVAGEEDTEADGVKQADQTAEKSSKKSAPKSENKAEPKSEDKSDESGDDKSVNKAEEGDGRKS